MSEEELSFQDDRAYPDNREEVTMSSMQSLKWITSTKPPYAERHVRWCGRKENESRPDNLLRFLTYPILTDSFFLIEALEVKGNVPFVHDLCVH